MKLQWKYAISAGLVLLLAVTACAQTPSGVVKGKVKEQGGKSLAAVLVQATNVKNKDDKHEVKSDDKGEFTLANLPAGDYALSFTKPGYRLFTTRKLEVVGGETLTLSRTIELARAGEPYSVIRGAVLHGVGYTLPNSLVTIERIDGGKKFKQETVAREGGEFAFRLRAERAKYRLTATARGFQTASVEVEIDSDEVRNVALTLQQAQ